MRRLLVEALPAGGGRVRADARGSHHLLHVLRIRPGARLRLSDGHGAQAEARFVGVEDGHALLEADPPQAPAPAATRVVVLGTPKPALLEEALTVGTEAGATRFVLVRARFSPPGALRAERLQRVLATAVTQCGRPDVPELVDVASLDAALRSLDVPADARWLAMPGGPAAPPDTGSAAAASDPGTADRPAGDDAAAVAIGPEGGWAPEEVQRLLDAGCQPLGLGPFVLRTPTAVAAALARLWRG